MTEEEVILALREHLEGQFPKSCPHCKRTFVSLKDYIRNTQPVGPAMPYDAMFGDWNPMNPVGSVAYANCPCGTTLAVSSKGMPLIKLWTILDWARVETQARGIDASQLLTDLREVIIARVLAEPD
jgi:hypothetical protein